MQKHQVVLERMIRKEGELTQKATPTSSSPTKHASSSSQSYVRFPWSLRLRLGTLGFWKLVRDRKMKGILMGLEKQREDDLELHSGRVWSIGLLGGGVGRDGGRRGGFLCWWEEALVLGKHGEEPE